MLILILALLTTPTGIAPVGSPDWPISAPAPAWPLEMAVGGARVTLMP